MDAETQRRKRQEALEEKKKRLEEMRKSKLSRDQAGSATPELPAPTPSPSLESNVSDSKINVDELVNSLLTTTTPTPTPPPPTAMVSDVTSVRSNGDAVHKKQVQLVVVKSVATVQIIPEARECYHKESQTDFQDDTEDETAPAAQTKTPSKLDRKRPPPSLTKLGRSDSLNGSAGGDLFDGAKTDTAVRTMTEGEKMEVVTSASFCGFVENSCRIMERALMQTAHSNLLIDYVSDDADSARAAGSNIMSLESCFEEDATRGRPVMDIQFSSSHPELFLVCYGARSGSSVRKAAPASLPKHSEDDPAGLVCVWSNMFPNRPEFKFLASSPVLSGCFHEEEQRLIYGGCYTGQILLWDMRAKALPVQRTSLSGKGHKHPVYSVHASNSPADLVTVSTDGTLCQWDLSRLSEPTHVVQLQSLFNQPTGSTATAANSMIVNSVAFGGDTGTGYRDIYFGAGSGTLLKGQLPFKATDTLSQVCLL
jgi:dynein intermediate chain